MGTENNFLSNTESSADVRRCLHGDTVSFSLYRFDFRFIDVSSAHLLPRDQFASSSL